MPKFTTGPIENTGTPSIEVLLKALNNSSANTATVQARVFSLNGIKTLLFESGPITLDPQSSVVIASVDLSDVVQYEVQFEHDLTGASKNKVQFSSWGFDLNGELNPSQRVVHAELSKFRLN
ncbi:hypothetical protein [Priestia endophytica]|uniref:hypothetical protein n=1 Tax=Priestia endophytica TaxID=135735 RepID=UPI00203E6A79|nr:hypothetical protein [Priestia endophytica]MCM3541177.1 hypothetical protein [Priestia endophytica]